MIVLDASYLVVLLSSNPTIAKDRNDQPVPYFKERVSALVANLNASGQIIGIPAPALAEVLVHAGA